jgi:hypothetical protein
MAPTRRGQHLDGALRSVVGVQVMPAWALSPGYARHGTTLYEPGKGPAVAARYACAGVSAHL